MNRILFLLRRYELVNSDNENIVIFGLKQIKYILQDVSLALCCGILIENIYAAIAYLVSFWLLRIYAGGYHAKIEKLCKYISLSGIVFAILIFIPLKLHVFVFFCSLLIALWTLYMKSPIAAPNKPVNERERIVYRRRSMFIAVSEIFFCTFFLILQKFELANAVLVALLQVALGLLKGNK